jgi:RNA polymerase sigma-70 factor (ECF subfamily)
VPQHEAPWASDREFVEQILKGDRKAFELLYETYFRRIYRFALRRLGDSGEAEDVTQEVFLAVIKALPYFQGTSSLLVWMFGITRNKANLYRMRRALPESVPGLDSAGRAALLRIGVR